MKAKELRDLTSEELMNKLNDFKSELFSLRFQLATGQLENTARIKFVKKDIAKVKTVLAERKLYETRANLERRLFKHGKRKKKS
ncbi:50S ribosomal protein L29 [Clostridioides difficile]|nr:50S ribosomal protein L29 [Clostridioides difficile]EQH50499.1 ribosomal protein L29 [Clostridioides difficile DA00246]